MLTRILVEDMGSDQWFIDETKVSGLTFAVVSINSADIGACRAKMVKLPRRVGGALHFTKEIDSTRVHALRLIAAMPLTVTLVKVPAGVHPVEARERAVRCIARRALDQRPVRIVFELDEAAVINDRRWLRSELATAGIEYLHLGKKADPVLWIPDGIAWAVQRGGRWRMMIDHLITDSVDA